LSEESVSHKFRKGLGTKINPKNTLTQNRHVEDTIRKMHMDIAQLFSDQLGDGSGNLSGQQIPVEVLSSELAHSTIFSVNPINMSSVSRVQLPSSYDYVSPFLFLGSGQLSVFAKLHQRMIDIVNDSWLALNSEEMSRIIKREQAKMYIRDMEKKMNRDLNSVTSGLNIYSKTDVPSVLMQYVWEMGKLLRIRDEGNTSDDLLFEEKKKVRSSSEELTSKIKGKGIENEVQNIEESVRQSSDGSFSRGNNKNINNKRSSSSQLFENALSCPTVAINQSLLNDVRHCLSASPSAISCFSPGFSMRSIEPHIEYSVYSTPESLSKEGKKVKSLKERDDSIPAIIVNKESKDEEEKNGNRPVFTPRPLESSGRLQYTSYPSLLTAPSPSAACIYQV
jgi:hypothetical protein